MLIKLFGLMDLISAIVFILLKYGIGESIAYIFILYLLGKGLLFFGDFNSLMDLLTGVFLFLAVQGIFIFISWLLIFYLLQKAILSMVA